MSKVKKTLTLVQIQIDDNENRLPDNIITLDLTDLEKSAAIAIYDLILERCTNYGYISIDLTIDGEQHRFHRYY